MAQSFIAKVVTINDLRKGDVAYLTDADDWTRDLAKAETLHDEATTKARLALASGHELKVIGAYLVDVTPAEGSPEPRHLREDFRRTGPSNYFHGKQENANNVYIQPV